MSNDTRAGFSTRVLYQLIESASDKPCQCMEGGDFCSACRAASLLNDFAEEARYYLQEVAENKKVTLPPTEAGGVPSLLIPEAFL